MTPDEIRAAVERVREDLAHLPDNVATGHSSTALDALERECLETRAVLEDLVQIKPEAEELRRLRAENERLKKRDDIETALVLLGYAVATKGLDGDIDVTLPGAAYASLERKFGERHPLAPQGGNEAGTIELRIHGPAGRISVRPRLYSMPISLPRGVTYYAQTEDPTDE